MDDDPAGAALAVGHLASLGHRRIAHIDGGDGAGSRGRRRGYERAMELHGLAKQADDRRVADDVPERHPGGIVARFAP